ncbi:DUF2161 family putative PD-(D/E)XK-type phosphodiesterase [Vallitalea okinawensis]|uniref:DUF2161 family putative PD-(D/E)XK-type phosphodiesterase n=1 Tax=Vallitalea okinawensis TaxID=2078660 RepID=UPI001FA82860|nr:DUF2161 family putative PD-(D/E)XK-type phosphodiesterase [Vallitalea okinawensis]
MLEKDLYQPIKDYFIKNGYLVRGEVEDCDVIAVKDEVITVVELKKNLTVKLLTQAVKRQKIGDQVYMAIPKPKGFRYSRSWNDTVHLIRRLELGLLFVSFKGEEKHVEVVIEPKVFNRKRSQVMNKKRRARLINEVKERHEDFNIGGTTGVKLVTAYKEKAIHIACCLNRFETLTTKELRELGTDQAKTTRILYNNHYSWFEKVGRGVYQLSETGKKELKDYATIAKYYNQIIDEAIKSSP